MHYTLLSSKFFIYCLVIKQNFFNSNIRKKKFIDRIINKVFLSKNYRKKEEAKRNLKNM